MQGWREGAAAGEGGARAASFAAFSHSGVPLGMPPSRAPFLFGRSARGRVCSTSVSVVGGSSTSAFSRSFQICQASPAEHMPGQHVWLGGERRCNRMQKRKWGLELKAWRLTLSSSWLGAVPMRPGWMIPAKRTPGMWRELA